MSETQKSKCCGAKVKVSWGGGEFHPGRTCCYECNKCENACDIGIPTEKLLKAERLSRKRKGKIGSGQAIDRTAITSAIAKHATDEVLCLTRKELRV